MTVLGITPRDWHKVLQRRGCSIVRHTGGHAIYETPDGARFPSPAHGRGKGKVVVTGKVVRTAAEALGTTPKDLLQR